MYAGCCIIHCCCLQHTVLPQSPLKQIPLLQQCVLMGCCWGHCPPPRLGWVALRGQRLSVCCTWSLELSHVCVCGLECLQSCTEAGGCSKERGGVWGSLSLYQEVFLVPHAVINCGILLSYYLMGC